jgi:1,3-beta-galactosyl-N-acetylhexosamine phosphorylase
VLNIKISDRFIRKVNVGEVQLAAKNYGKGRGVYISGLPYTPENARLLLRAMFWSAHKEDEMMKAYSSNVVTDCTYYPESGKYAIINNTDKEQVTDFYDMNGNKETITLGANEIVWRCDK